VVTGVLEPAWDDPGPFEKLTEHRVLLERYSRLGGGGGGGRRVARGGGGQRWVFTIGSAPVNAAGASVVGGGGGVLGGGRR